MVTGGTPTFWQGGGAGGAGAGGGAGGGDQYYVVDATTNQPIGPYPAQNMYEMYMAQQVLPDQSCVKVGDQQYITVHQLMVSWGYA